jgi:hypothetical protein
MRYSELLTEKAMTVQFDYQWKFCDPRLLNCVWKWSYFEDAKTDNFVGCLTNMSVFYGEEVGYLYYYQQYRKMARDLLNHLPNTHQGG